MRLETASVWVCHSRSQVEPAAARDSAWSWACAGSGDIERGVCVAVAENISEHLVRGCKTHERDHPSYSSASKKKSLHANQNA